MDSSKSGSVQSYGLTLLFAVLLVCTSCSAFEKVLAKAKIDGIDTHDLDVYVEKKVRYLHVKIDLKPAISGLITLNKCVELLSKNSQESLEYALYKSLYKRVNRIVERLARISGKHYLTDRNKRSIEFLGDLISDIFGNPGPSDWKKVNANILALENALKRIDENVSLNHEDIDTDRHIIEQHNKEIKSLSLLINRNQNDIVNINKEMLSLKTFFEISTLADTLDSLTLALVEIKNHGMKGYCSDRALSKDFLIENLQNMEANKVGISPIFGSWEWRNYFRFEMCTLALVKESLWMTIRIPLVKKSEQLVRVIPNFSLKSLVTRAEMYGVKLVIFKEKDNDEFHVMSQTNFDLCNILGNTRSCGIRDVRINSHSSVLAIEILLDRFMITSNKLASTMVTEKCPGTVREISLKLDTVISAPVNCSYKSNDFGIETRESDVEITSEIGLMAIDKLEINEIENYHEKVSKVFVESIANRSSHDGFERNKKEIKNNLDMINTKHDSAWKAYNFEKWLLVGGLLSLTIIIFALKIRSFFVSKKVRSTTFREIAELRSNLTNTRDDFSHEVMSLHVLDSKDKDDKNNESAINLEEIKKANFSSPTKRSQFL